ncbi:ATP-binding cassette domain-containing protein [Streptomyces sp. NPDC051018]|uniref:ATP-binding cassette domain-containing protein n=1 Tax=Streptomyces sp. NPDC051018 TaxID=3365639 RepID=UPI0037AFD678
MDSPQGAAVVAEGFGLRGPRGWAFRSVDIDAGPGSLIAVEGPSGTGRTCLLLALTGRMRPAEGRAEVGGLALPRRMAAVRGISALGHVPGVNELDPALTVTEHLRERALLRRRFDGSLRALLRPRADRAADARRRIDGALETAGLDLAELVKEGRTPVRDLERLEALRLSVALALVGRPRLLAVDDTDLKLSAAERAEAWALLSTVAGSGTTVLAVCSQAPEGTAVVRTGGDTAPGNRDHDTTTGSPDTDRANPDDPGPDDPDPDLEDTAGGARPGGAPNRGTTAHGTTTGNEATGHTATAPAADGDSTAAPGAAGARHGADGKGASDAFTATGRA